MIVGVAGPQGSEICYCGDLFFVLLQKVHKIFIGSCLQFVQSNLRDFLVFHSECNDGFPEIFGDVFGLVFEGFRGISSSLF
jgi:hypothetical protein